MNSSTPFSHSSPRRKMASSSFGTSTENIRLAIPWVDFCASDDISSSMSFVFACDRNPSNVSRLAYRNSTALLNAASSRSLSCAAGEGSRDVSMDPALPHTGPRTMYWRDHALSTTSETRLASAVSGKLNSVRVCGQLNVARVVVVVARPPGAHRCGPVAVDVAVSFRWVWYACCRHHRTDEAREERRGGAAIERHQRRFFRDLSPNREIAYF
jgi:hypothetical protein